MRFAGIYVARLLGILWALPNTVIGLLAGAIGMPFGAKPEFSRKNAV